MKSCSGEQKFSTIIFFPPFFIFKDTSGCVNPLEAFVLSQEDLWEIMYTSLPMYKMKTAGQ